MKLLEQLSKIALIGEIDQLKKQVDDLRPFTKEVEQRIFQKFRLDWNYHSNAIEGNPYTYGETVAFILHGITAKGKRLKDHLDIQGHNEAIDLMMSMIRGDREFSENDIRELHKIVLQKPYHSPAITPDEKETRKLIKIGQYKDSPNHVKTITGKMHYYATPEETPIKMAELVEWYRTASQNTAIHPLVLAAVFHHKFVAIHPFDDGNGRLGRILMNFILMKNHYPPVVIPIKERDLYFAALSQADAREMTPIVEYIGEGLKHSLSIQLRGAKGEVIMEETDLDKEIALVKAMANREDVWKTKRNDESLWRTLNNSILPLFYSILGKAELIGELFIDSSYTIQVDYIGELDIEMEQVYEDMQSYIEEAMDYDYDSVRQTRFGFWWENFKKTKKIHNAYFVFLIKFHVLNYVVYYKDTPIIEKPYHEDLTEQEIIQIRDSLIRPVLKEIEGWMKADNTN